MFAIALFSLLERSEESSERVLAGNGHCKVGHRSNAWSVGLGSSFSDPFERLRSSRADSPLRRWCARAGAGGFQTDADIDASVAWMVEFLDRGFRAATT